MKVKHLFEFPMYNYKSLLQDSREFDGRVAGAPPPTAANEGLDLSSGPPPPPPGLQFPLPLSFPPFPIFSAPSSIPALPFSHSLTQS